MLQQFQLGAWAAPRVRGETVCFMHCRQPSRWRFSIGSLLMLMTVLSLALGLIRAIPMSEEMRQAFLVLGGMWAVVTLIVLAPAWFHFAEIQRRASAAREKELRECLSQAKRPADDFDRANEP